MFRLLAILLLLCTVSPAASDRALVGTFSAASATPRTPLTLTLTATTNRTDPERYTIALALPPGTAVLTADTSPASVCIPFPSDTLSCYGGITAGQSATFTLTLALDRCEGDMALALPASFAIRDTFTPLTATFTLPVAPPCPIYLPIMHRGTS